jgi:hypothetical protein
MTISLFNLTSTPKYQIDIVVSNRNYRCYLRICCFVSFLPWDFSTPATHIFPPTLPSCLSSLVVFVPLYVHVCACVVCGLVLSCLVLSCFFLVTLILTPTPIVILGRRSCLVLFCLALCSLVFSCLVLSCIVFSCVVMSCIVLLCL